HQQTRMMEGCAGGNGRGRPGYGAEKLNLPVVDVNRRTLADVLMGTQHRGCVPVVFVPVLRITEFAAGQCVERGVIANRRGKSYVMRLNWPVVPHLRVTV